MKLASFTNIEFAIMRSVDELLTRYGINPTELVVAMYCAEDSHREPETKLTFGAGEALNHPRMPELCKALGMDYNDDTTALELSGSDSEVYGILRAAIDRAPNRARGNNPR